jgi:hypothetical protein
MTACPREASHSASVSVASTPWLGEAVTVTVEPGGSAPALSRTLFNGISSYLAPRTSVRSAFRSESDSTTGRRPMRHHPISTSAPLL